MFEEFFNRCKIQNPEMVTAEQSEKIKASLRKRVAENSQLKQTVKEEKNMKIKNIRTVVIAAAIAALGAGSVAVAASTVRTATPSSFQSWDDFQQIANELAKKNSVSKNYHSEIGCVPRYEDMEEINELLVTEMIVQLDETKRIYLTHFEDTIGTSRYIEPDGNGGYKILGDEKPIEDKKLLAAIQKGIPKYGESFMIWY